MKFTENSFQNELFLKVDQINSQLQRIVLPIAKRHGLNPNSAFTLLMIEQNEECSIGQLQRNLCLNQGNTSSLCKKLEQRGLIERTRKKEDERVVLLRLSNYGKEVLESMDQEMQGMCKILDEKITEDEKNMVLQGMDSLSRILNAIEKGGASNA